MTWTDANTWANNLVVDGDSGWRLPMMLDPGACVFSLGGGTDCGYNVRTKIGDTVYSEMAYLYYVELDNMGWCTQGDVICDTPQIGRAGVSK